MDRIDRAGLTGKTAASNHGPDLDELEGARGSEEGTRATTATTANACQRLPNEKDALFEPSISTTIANTPRKGCHHTRDMAALSLVRLPDVGIGANRLRPS